MLACQKSEGGEVTYSKPLRHAVELLDRSVTSNFDALCTLNASLGNRNILLLFIG